MRFTTTRNDDASVLAIVGDLRIVGLADARPALIAMLAAGGDIQLDLRDLGDCDTAGLQLLLMLRASATARGGRCTTIGHTEKFLAALDRVGISRACFESRTVPATNDDRGGIRSGTLPPDAATAAG